ncbi:hypothetical protein OS493_028579 [Desmophyllum pertusum]|uniref:Uncharacterized protein n=1 Tax=Desmophyllum pertusum TaxID=174260 RepID=A0A9W9YWX3_9CNID|nr:hypothetical protein OS493_028579 [Desmophyllum pertusum]
MLCSKVTKLFKGPEWARTSRERKPSSSIIGRPKEHSEAKPKTKPKPEWKTTSLRKKDTNKPATTQSDYWKEARPDWAKGKSPVGDKPKIPDKPKTKAKEYWEEARPDWSKGKPPVAKPRAEDIKKVEEKKKYDYPTPEWAHSRVRGKDKASDEQDGNKGLLKAELENIFGKPKQKVTAWYDRLTRLYIRPNCGAGR